MIRRARGVVPRGCAGFGESGEHVEAEESREYSHASSSSSSVGDEIRLYSAVSGIVFEMLLESVPCADEVASISSLIPFGTLFVDVISV